MKVVIFCGGFGMRLREFAPNTPKPLVNIGYRPVLWHVMKYYAHFGHRDFILCLGYRADSIKEYFLSYSECLSNDFVLSQGGKRLELFNRDITGLASHLCGYRCFRQYRPERLKAVEKYLDGAEVFLANYCDGLPTCIFRNSSSYFEKHDKVAAFVSVRPNLTYHLVSADQMVSLRTYER